jgi:PncC family amidohydrolase
MMEDKVVAELKKRNLKITTAESCTGGMIAATIVNVSGASDVLEEGYITYSNDAKRKLLGVKQETLEQYGAVSRQVAEQMAKGAALAAGAEAALSATGIAGPGGGTDEKPVGLVYIGCYLSGRVVVTENIFQGSRTEVRQQTTEAALKLLLDCMME